MGVRARSAAAAVRAGICRFEESAVLDKNLEPQVLSLVGEPYLPPLDPALADTAMAPVRARLLRLGGLALAEALAAWADEPPPLMLALPEARAEYRDLAAGFVRDLARQAGTVDQTGTLRGFPSPSAMGSARQAELRPRVELDERRSRVYRQGGAGGLHALRDALGMLDAGHVPAVVVGGVDSFLDLLRLGELGAADRLAGASGDGFIPGEGAAFLVLGSRRQKRRPGLEPLGRILAVGLGAEAGHRYAPAPYLGEGLAEAFAALFAQLPPSVPPVRCVYAGFNGERFATKEWGVAYLRNAEHFAEDMRIEHPADCVGDAGAALGPIMLALAAIGMQRGYRPEPCLVWSTSDREARGAALLRTT